MEMKRFIVALVFVFGALAAQEKQIPASPNNADAKIQINAEEFQRVKDLLFGLALENYKLGGKKDAEPLDLMYALILENQKIKSEHVVMLKMVEEMSSEIKAAQNVIQAKAVLKKYGL
jgi:hypothetical protein